MAPGKSNSIRSLPVPTREDSRAKGKKILLPVGQVKHSCGDTVLKVHGVNWWAVWILTRYCPEVVNFTVRCVLRPGVNWWAVWSLTRYCPEAVNFTVRCVLRPNIWVSSGTITTRSTQGLGNMAGNTWILTLSLSNHVGNRKDRGSAIFRRTRCNWDWHWWEL